MGNVGAATTWKGFDKVLTPKTGAAALDGLLSGTETSIRKPSDGGFGTAVLSALPDVSLAGVRREGIGRKGENAIVGLSIDFTIGAAATCSVM